MGRAETGTKETQLIKALFDFEYYGNNFKAIQGDIEKLYNYAEYFAAFTIAGTVIEKLAKYPISNITVTATAADRKEIWKILRKIKLRERLMQIGMAYGTYGLTCAVPMKAIKKQIKCKKCGEIYDLRDLEKNDHKKYTFDGGKFSFACRNEKCEQYNMSAVFEVIDYPVTDLNKLNIAIWSPYNLRPIRNDITGETQWLYKIPPATQKLIKEGNHFVLCHTPQLYIDAIFLSTTQEVRLDEDSIYIFEAPTMKISGKPIPPMVRAFRSLAMNEAYLAANKIIAKELLVPFRMMFPVDRGTLGKPVTNTISLSKMKNVIQAEIAKWREDPNYVPFMPIEIGSKDFWGNGKMLVLHDQLRNLTQDILAEIGAPIEFIYGGATWSRQNVSAIILESSFKAMADMFQEMLDALADIINKSMGLSDKCTIRLGVPRLVEAMAENSYIKEGMEAGDISKPTYYERFNIDYDEESQTSTKDNERTRTAMEEKGKNMGFSEVARAKVLANYKKEEREMERKEQLRDSLVMSAINSDNTATQIESQKKLLEMQSKVQLRERKISEKSQLKMMKENNKLQIELMRKQMNLNLEAEKEQAYAQEEISGNIENNRMQQEQQSAMESGVNNLSPQEKANLETMPKEQQQEYLVNKGREFNEKMAPPEQQDAEDEPAKKAPAASKVDKKAKGRQPSSEAEDDSGISQLIRALIGAPEGEERNKLLKALEQQYPEQQEQVLKIVDDEITKMYVSDVINVNPGKEDGIFNEINKKHPRLYNAVGDEVQKQFVLLEQAKRYATALYKAKDIPKQYSVLMSEINRGAPDEFKIMITKYYEALLNAEYEKAVEGLNYEENGKKQSKNESLRIKDIISNLKSMDSKTKEEFLLSYQHEEPELFSKIMAGMDQIQTEQK